MLLQSPRGQLGLTEYSTLKVRQFDEIDGETLTWLQASKMLNRSERFLRMVRSLAFGAGKKNYYLHGLFKIF
jgi:hypothetical protein